MYNNTRVYPLFLGLLTAWAVPAGAAVVVGDVAALTAAVAAANEGGDPEILLADGDYPLEEMLWIAAPGVILRSQSGNREAVILRGQGMAGGVTHIFNVAGAGFTARDLTLREVSQHAVQLQADVDGVTLSNLHILDTGEQMIKVAYDPAQPERGSDYGVLEGSLLEYSAGIGPQWYIGGIDAHAAVGWTVRDNTFRAIRSPADAPAEYAIHFWSDARDTLVERNRILNCDRGIGFGLGERGHIDGIIRNNMLYNDDTQGFADVGIALENAASSEVYNNTLILLSGYPNAIEYRFAGTYGGLIANNLSNAAITARDGGSATEANNLVAADPGWFVNAAAGDLHLLEARPEVVDQGGIVAGLNDDYDGELRPLGHGIDLGADEWSDAGGCTGVGPVAIRDRSFAAGSAIRCSSDTAIDAGPNVTIQAGATLELYAPVVRLGVGVWAQAGSRLVVAATGG
jgi:hypothetical protein